MTFPIKVKGNCTQQDATSLLFAFNDTISLTKCCQLISECHFYVCSCSDVSASIKHDGDFCPVLDNFLAKIPFHRERLPFRFVKKDVSKGVVSVFDQLFSK